MSDIRIMHFMSRTLGYRVSGCKKYDEGTKGRK
jgi:hypothetical protein